MNEKNGYVELRNINKNFGDFQASKDINISISRGKLVALLGPSGSGKTTILRMIAGLEHPDSGQILIDGKVVNDVPGSERGIGFVFQSYALFRYMTVFENIAFGLRVKKAPEEKIREKVDELLRLIGCEGLEKRYPSQLSGGQRQRVAFARALAPDPQILLPGSRGFEEPEDTDRKILLLDEPFAAIDAKVRLELRTWLREMISRIGITSIFVTHDQDEAIEVADEIIVTNQGRVEQAGTPTELYARPATPFVARFIGNSVPVNNYGSFRYFEDAGENSTGIVRPEFISIFKKGESVQFAKSAEEGVVEDIIFRGSSLEVRVRIHGNVLSALRSFNDPEIRIGETVDVFLHRMFIIREDQVHLAFNQSLRTESVFL